MSSISSAAMQSYSPLQRLQTTLASEISAGNISATDQSALSSSLSDIDAALKSQMESGGTRPSPEEMQSKIDSLIANEVSEGDLTAEQAAELKNVFSTAFQGGPGGAGGAGGPPPGPPPSGEADSDDSTSTSTSSSSSDSDVAKLMQDFLKLIQDSQGSSSYSANGGSSLLSQIQSLIVNYQA
jgi:hypothetical protein